MKIRVISVLMICVLLLSAALCPAGAEDLWLNPPEEWWGMSKTAFTDAYKDDKFTELDIDGLKALSLTPMMETDDLTLDVYFRFADKAPGKSWYGLSEVTYLVPVGKKLSDNQLKSLYSKLRGYIVSQNGKADESGATEAVWNLNDITVTLAVKAYRKYNRSTSKTVGVTYVKKLSAPAETGGKANSGAKSGTLTVTAQATCNDYNHVGEKWSQVFYVNGTRFKDSKSVELKAGDEITVRADITEEDSQPDKGTGSATRVITEKDLQEGFKIRFTVSVEENGGRYKGQAAKWSVTFTFSK